MPGTIANVLVGRGTLKAAAFGGSPADMGYTEQGLDLEYSQQAAKITPDEETFAIDMPIETEAVKVKAILWEQTAANLKLVMGGMNSSGQLGDGVQQYLTIQVVGKKPNGALGTRTWYFPKVVSTGTNGIKFGKAKVQGVPVEFEALKTQGNPACYFTDS